MRLGLGLALDIRQPVLAGAVASPSITATDANGSVTDLGSGTYRGTKTGGGAAFNAGFHGPLQAADFAYKIVVNSILDLMVGVSTAPSAASGFADMSQQVYLDGGGTVQSYTGSSTSGTVGSYVSGDTIWVTRSGSTVEFRKGAVLGTATLLRSTTVSGTIGVDFSLFTVAATFDVTKTA
jgi:hypothetical protein